MAYLILAHDGEEQLRLLCEKLVPPGSPDIAIIHADARSDLWRSLRRQQPIANTLYIEDPRAVRWGHMSQVEAISKLVSAALASGCDYAHLISGADWPIVSRDRMLADIEAAPLPPVYAEARRGEQAARMQSFRLDTKWLRLDADKDPLAYAITWQLRRLSRWIEQGAAMLGLSRSLPFGEWHKGATWWSLPREALEVLGAELPVILRSGRLRGTVCADEHLVPTILAARFAGRLEGNRRFLIFPQSASSPLELTREHLPQIANSDGWFMRKISLSHDPFFLDLPAGQGNCRQYLGECSRRDIKSA